MNIEKEFAETFKDEIKEAMSRRDALKMAAAKAAFFRKGGKVEKQPPSIALGYTKKRGMKLGKTSHASGSLDIYRGIDDQDAAKELEKYKKEKGYTSTKDKIGNKPNPFYGRGRADRKPRYKGGYKFKGKIPKEEVEIEASTYRDKAKDDEKKKKRHFAFGGKQDKTRHGKGGYGKGEEVEEKKAATGYELYHKDFSSAMQHAVAHAKKKGFVVDPKEIDDKVATGPKKPSSGKTNRYALKAGRKTVHIQVANLDNKRFELNMYIEEKQPKLGEEKMKDLVKTIQDIMIGETNKNDKSDDGEGLDAVQPKAVKKKFKDRKDKDIDNDGDVDSSDKFLHKRRKAISKAVNKEETELDEAYWKVNIPDMPPVFIEAASKSDIIKNMRKRLKPDVFKELAIEKVTRATMVKMYRALAKGKGEDDNGEEEPTESVKKKVAEDKTYLAAKSKLPPHLAKFFDKDGNLKKDAAARVAKGREKINWIDVTPKGYGPKEEVELDEGTGLQMKMAFDDAKIKVKGVKGGKLVIAKKDKKKATDVLSKSLKKGSNINKVIDKMIVFEEVELDEASNKKAMKKVADEIEAIADKGGAEAPAMFSIASRLRKGQLPTGQKVSKQVSAIFKKHGLREEKEKTISKIFSHIKSLMKNEKNV